MKHTFITYALFAALAVTVPTGCSVDKAQPEKKTSVAVPVKTDPKAEAEAQRKAAHELQQKRSKEIQAVADNKKLNLQEKLNALRGMLANPDYSSNVLQENILNRILDVSRPFWGGVGDGNHETVGAVLIPTVNELVKSDRISVYGKRKALEVLTYHYCDRKMFAEAEKTARQAIALEKLPAMDKARAYVVLSDVFRYQDKLDDAMNALGDIEKIDPKAETALHVFAVHARANLYLHFDREAEAEKLIDSLNDPYDKLVFYQEIGYAYLGQVVSAPKQAWQAKHGKTLAVKYVSDLSNPEKKRVEIARRYLIGSFGTPEMSVARRSLAGIPAKEKGDIGEFQMKLAFQNGDMPLAVELCEIMMNTPRMESATMKKIYVIALACVDRKADAAKFATRYATEPGVTPVDRVRFNVYAAILSGKSADDILKNSGLPRKETSEVLLSAARQCLLWGMTDLARKYAAEYEAYFMPKQEQTLIVKYFDKPVSNISQWRKIHGQLDKKYCDIPFKGSMDFLETDVSTGQRSIHFEKNAKIQHFMEVTAVCDIEGIHIFLRVEDEKARSIQNGFANGMGTEMYFAPGRNQPYVCIGSDAAKGVAFIWQSTYNNKNHRRPDRRNPLSFRSETEFTDTDYVLHMCFNWRDYYNKLPSVSGTDYRYECIAWTPAGGFTWGGSQGIHSASNWGNLRIQITEKQLNAIRRSLIFQSYKSYRALSKNYTTEDPFDYWADKAIGDHDFYKTMLEPLKAELDTYAAMVKEDMSDADVVTVYTKAVPRWFGIEDEIDQLRRIYLSNQLTR